MEAAGQGSALASTKEKGCTERGGGRGKTHVIPPPPSPPPTNTSNKREVWKEGKKVCDFISSCLVSSTFFPFYLYLFFLSSSLPFHHYIKPCLLPTFPFHQTISSCISLPPSFHKLSTSFSNYPSPLTPFHHLTSPFHPSTFHQSLKIIIFSSL